MRARERPVGVSTTSVTYRTVLSLGVCVTCVCVRCRRHGTVPQRVRVLVVLRETHPSHPGVQHHRGTSLAQRPVAGRPGHHRLQGQGPHPAHADSAQSQVIVQRQVVQAVCVQLASRGGSSEERDLSVFTWWLFLTRIDK